LEPRQTWISAAAGQARASGRDLFILDLKIAGPEGRFVGSLARPDNLVWDGPNGLVYSIGGGVILEPVVSAERDGKGLRVTVADPRDASKTQTLIFTPSGADFGEVRFLSATPTVASVRRVGPEAAVPRWDSSISYRIAELRPSNTHLAALVAADQAARTSKAPIDWKAVAEADGRRRLEVREMIGGGDLHTATDYENAALIFQHGETADDTLLAHTLALVALKKGRPDAAWIAAATLDRYLQRIGQPQIYGTQWQVGGPGNGPASATQEPFKPSAVPDTLRAELNVPLLKDQADQRKLAKGR